MSLSRIAILDDTQNIALNAADWSQLAGRAEIDVLSSPIGSADEVVQRLQPYDVLVPMRERTAFPSSVIERLPRLRMIALTGVRAPTLDLAACTRAGVVVSNTGSRDSTASTAELTWALVMATTRHLARADAVMRAGGWHDGVPVGEALAGRRLGVVGLGKLGMEVAKYGKAFGMEVVAWSQNLTAEAAAAVGVRRVEKAELFATCDVVSLHLVLSDRTRGIVGKAELAAMKDGAALINTSRGPLVDEAALLAELTSGRLLAGLDVFDVEPLPADHALRRLNNVVLTPHLGYAAQAVFRQFYRESIENILAFLDGRPIRVINPDVVPKPAETETPPVWPQAHRPTM